MNYLVTTPWLMRKIWPLYRWSIDTKEKNIYLSFDDGPHPVATPFVLDELRKYQAKATFFCIGKNVQAYPGIYNRLLEEGHATGNHTQHHLNGWKTGDGEYLNDVHAASAHIRSSLFRPPYGRIRSSQARKIRQEGKQVIMWSVLSGDFDTALTKEKCYRNVADNAKAGSIVVFHDSEKAWPLMSYALPKVLAEFSAKGYRFESIPAYM